MADKIRERAILLEGLLPKVLRTLFRPDPTDPLVELPVGQMRMMRLLAMKAWTPSSLGEELGLSVSAVTQMANRLDSIGFLDRVEDPVDRRVKHLLLTPLGRDMMARRQQMRVCRLEMALANMPTERQTEFVALLEEIIEAGAKSSQFDNHSLSLESEVELKRAASHSQGDGDK